MRQVSRRLHQYEKLRQRVDQEQQDEAAHGNDQVPLFTLNQQGEEADVQVGVETGDLSHDELHPVPLVKGQDLFVVDLLLNIADGEHFENGVDHRVEHVDQVARKMEAASTLLADEHEGANEHDDVVDKGVHV